MKLVKVGVPVQVLFASAWVVRKDTGKPRAGSYMVRAYQHQRLGSDGLYIFSVGYDEGTDTGGFLMYVRASLFEEMYPAIKHRAVSPLWTSIFNHLKDMGTPESHIPAPRQSTTPPITGPADTADITAIRGDVYG
jgi:hypothetical protein